MFPRFKRGRRVVVSPVNERVSDGITFASKAEKKAYDYLKLRLRGRNMRLQEQFVLFPPYMDCRGENIRALIYVADFCFGSLRASASDPATPGMVVVDSKGMLTEKFLLKRKLFEKIYGVPIWIPRNAKDLAKLANHIETMENKSEIISTLSRDTFKVAGYRNSSGEVADYTFRKLDRDGYYGLIERSLLFMEDTRPGGWWETTVEELMRVKGFSREDLEQAGQEIRASLNASLEKRKNPTPAKEVKEKLVPVGHGVLYKEESPEFIVVLGLECLSKEARESPDKKEPNSALKTVVKRAIEARLPKARYVHRINLYPGQYESVS